MKIVGPVVRIYRSKFFSWMEKHPDDTIVNFDVLTYAGNLENLRAVEKINIFVCSRNLRCRCCIPCVKRSRYGSTFCCRKSR